ncbi:hypothetical protein KC19_11G144600, partial [Ceratodon purpureus]
YKIQTSQTVASKPRTHHLSTEKLGVRTFNIILIPIEQSFKQKQQSTHLKKISSFHQRTVSLMQIALLFRRATPSQTMQTSVPLHMKFLLNGLAPSEQRELTAFTGT